MKKVWAGILALIVFIVLFVTVLGGGEEKCLPGFGGGGQVAPDGKDVLIIGDSLTVGAQDHLEQTFPGVEIDAAVGRQASEGLRILAGKDIPKVVVFALGTNGAYDQGLLDQVKDAVGDSRLVVMTVAGEKVRSAAAVNALVEANSDDVRVADWAARVEAEPGLIGPDGVHPTPEGSKVFAETIVEGIGTFGSGGGVAANAEGLAYPMDPETPITSGFGQRWGTNHNGIDLAGPHGAPIYAFADGVVVAAGPADGFGNWIVIDHMFDGTKYSTVYGHMEDGQVHVSVGQNVAAGDHIADEGNAGFSTGPHLHFEIVEGGRLEGGTWVDPQPWLDRAKEGAGVPRSGDDGAGGDGSDGAASVQAEAPEGASVSEIQKLRASQIIALGKQRGEEEFTIMAALQAALVESELQNLASEAVPESKQYPHDGVAAGDFDSVGLYQQRVSVWGEQAGGMEGLMDPAQQINWFYDTAEGLSAPTPGQLAAAVERPREDLRYKYDLRAEEAKALYAELEGVDPDSIVVGGVDNCDNESGVDRRAAGAGLPNGDIGERILVAARSQFGLPYVWGGGDHNGPTSGGFDCSGLTMYAVYQATDGAVALNHFTGDQQADPQLETVSWADRQPGDLIFTPGHVAIYAGEIDGQEMMYEAQQTGVPVGAFPVRGGESATVRRVPAQDAPAADDASDTSETERTQR